MSATPPQRRHTATWIVIAVLLAASLVGTLWVPFYNRATPALGGFPFYYWYQLLWIPVVALLSWLAYQLAKTTRRAENVPGGAPGGSPGGDGHGGELT